MMNKKEHLTKEGLQKIVNHRASMNRGLSEDLYKNFPNTIPVVIPLSLNPIISTSKIFN